MLLDQVQYGNSGKSLWEVLSDRTKYSHTSSQECCEWIPTKIGLDVWNNGENDDAGSYVVQEIEMTLAGATPYIPWVMQILCAGDETIQKFDRGYGHEVIQ